MSKLINDEVRSEYEFPHLYSQAYVSEKDKEINRLNNIIDNQREAIEKLENQVVKLSEQVSQYQDEIFARDNNWYDMQD